MAHHHDHESEASRAGEDIVGGMLLIAGTSILASSTVLQVTLWTVIPAGLIFVLDPGNPMWFLWPLGFWGFGGSFATVVHFARQWGWMASHAEYTEREAAKEEQRKADYIASHRRQP